VAPKRFFYQSLATKEIKLATYHLNVFRRCSHRLVTGSSDGTVRLWDLTAKDPAANPVVLPSHESGVIAAGISPDNHWLVTGSKDGTVRADGAFLRRSASFAGHRAIGSPRK
jgi:WD40 repeat protein